jgi:uncharacterized protein (TIGR02145 family)
MRMIKGLSAVLFLVSLCIAQKNITISGIVVKSKGLTPIAGATVRLEKYGLQTNTATDGSFTIGGTTRTITIDINKKLSGKITVSLHNGYMSLRLREKSDVEIAVHTIQGKELSSIHKTLDIGSHSVAMPTVASGVYFYRIHAGNEEFMLKSNTLGCISRCPSLSKRGTSPTALTKQKKVSATFADVINVVKEGQLNYRDSIKVSDTSGIIVKMIPNAGNLADADGNIYQSVRIGNQVWTTVNLRTTKYNDGTPIPLVTDALEWSNISTPRYCWYGNSTNAAEQEKWGALYNWDAVITGKLAPTGWHVPTDAEWTVLEEYLIVNEYNWDGSTSGNKTAKSLAAKTDWSSSSQAGTVGNDLNSNNSTGFTALPGGSCSSDGNFYGKSTRDGWWSTTQANTSNAWGRHLINNNESLYRYIGDKQRGLSIRLIKDLTPPPLGVTDIDDNFYPAVTIGNQVWTSENLRTTQYNDGTPIPQVRDTYVWTNLSTPGYCWYDNSINAAKQEKWGALYNWYAVNTGKLAPTGWHVPTDADWTVLEEYLIANEYNWDGSTSGDKTGKSLAAKTDWSFSSQAGTVGNNLSSNNSTGFSALPGGYRISNYNGNFHDKGNNGTWWSSTEKLGSSYAYGRTLRFALEKMDRYYCDKKFGCSVRLVRD